MTQNNPASSMPRTLADVWRVWRAAGMPEAEQSALRRRLLSLQIRTAAVERQKLLIIESAMPLRAAGYWMPELAELVGADLVISRKGEAPLPVDLAGITAAAPDIAIIACAGTDLEGNSHFAALFAALGCPLFAADAVNLFWKPDAALVDTAELLAEILHQDDRLHFGHRSTHWMPILPPNPHYPQGT